MSSDEGNADLDYGFRPATADDLPMIGRWLASEGGRSEIERHWNLRRIAHIRRETLRHLPQAQPLSDRVFGEFIRLLSPRPRGLLLPSR
jgi:hypothetical protein